MGGKWISLRQVERKLRKPLATVVGDPIILFEPNAPAKRFIRRLDLSGGRSGAVRLETFAFTMVPRSMLNPLEPEP